MRKETDLARVKMIAHVLLDMPIAETSFSPAIVSHPFTSTGVTAAQNEDGNITVVDLLHNKEDYAKWKEMVGKQIDSAENACQVFFLLNKPYYLTFLKFSAPVLSQEDLGQLLAHAWILEECPNQDRNVSKRELLALFHSVPPELLMDEEEYAVYQSLEDPVTVYRGVTSYNAKNIKALSWTLDRDTAEWFAHRFGEEGTVYEAQISKEHNWNGVVSTVPRIEHGPVKSISHQINSTISALWCQPAPLYWMEWWTNTARHIGRLDSLDPASVNQTPLRNWTTRERCWCSLRIP